MKAAKYFFNITALMIVLALGSGCSSQIPAERVDLSDTQEASKAPPLQNTTNPLMFLDSDSFDKKLSLALETQAGSNAITIRFIEPVKANEIPDRLDRWLGSVEDYKGSVELTPDPSVPRSRGLITEAFSVAVGAHQVIREKALYNPSKKYNVRIYYDQGTGTLTKFEFIPKPAEK